MRTWWISWCVRRCCSSSPSWRFKVQNILSARHMCGKCEQNDQSLPQGSEIVTYRFSIYTVYCIHILYTIHIHTYSVYKECIYNYTCVWNEYVLPKMCWTIQLQSPRGNPMFSGQVQRWLQGILRPWAYQGRELSVVLAKTFFLFPQQQNLLWGL